MTLTQLKYILAVATHQHFGRAAEKCLVTQPTLSIQIQKLEDDLNIRIFDRSKQPVVPTEEGLIILRQAKIILEESKKLRHLAQATKSDTQVKGHLKIAVLPSIAPYLLPLFLRKMLDKYSGISVEIMELHNYQIVGRLQQDRADVAITVAPVGVDGFYETPLFKEAITVYLSPDQPLAAMPKIRLDELDLKELLLTDDTQNMADILASLQEQAPTLTNKFDSHKRLIYRSGSMETIRKLIEKEGGMTLLPALATLYMGERRKKYVRYFENIKPMRPVVLLVQRGFEKQKLVNILKEEVLQYLPKTEGLTFPLGQKE